MPILRDNGLKTIFLQVNALLRWYGLRYCSVNDDIHQFASHFQAGFRKCYRVGGVFVIAFGNNVRNSKAFLERGRNAGTAVFEADRTEGAEKGIIDICFLFSAIFSWDFISA